MRPSFSTCWLGSLVIILVLGFATQIWAQPLPHTTRYEKPKVITLDPGHGGHDLGVVGPNGIQEKEVTLQLARHVKKALGGNVSVRLTRDGDYSVDAENRSAISNRHQSDVFLSFHAGGAYDHTAQGLAVFYHTNGILLKNGVVAVPDGPRPWHEIQLAHTKKSKQLAKCVHEKLAKTVVIKHKTLDRGIHDVPLYILEGSDAPSILVEIGYLTHPAEEDRLHDQALLMEMGRAIAEGILAFLKEESHGCMMQEGMVEEDL